MKFIRLPRFLRPEPLSSVVERALYEARREFLEAAAAAEGWKARSDMLERRIARLTSYLTSVQPK